MNDLANAVMPGDSEAVTQDELLKRMVRGLLVLMNDMDELRSRK